LGIFYNDNYSIAINDHGAKKQPTKKQIGLDWFIDQFFVVKAIALVLVGIGLELPVLEPHPLFNSTTWGEIGEFAFVVVGEVDSLAVKPLLVGLLPPTLTGESLLPGRA